MEIGREVQESVARRVGRRTTSISLILEANDNGRPHGVHTMRWSAWSAGGTGRALVEHLT